MRKNRILIVEDEKKLLRTMEDYLRFQDYEILTAENGHDALQIFYREQGRIDLILLDVMLPDLDGYEVLREIRRVLDTPVIMLTAKHQGGAGSPEGLLEREVCGDDPQRV